MAVEIVRRETINPSSPTPPNLKIFKLSFLDQIAPPVYTSLVLFYPTKHNTDDDINTISDHLKKSLSEALSRFPQLAGRIDGNDTTAIECTDDGAPYVEAKFNGALSTFLDHPSEEELEQFIPTTIESGEAATGPLLLVQATFFDCGGLAIGICISHKFADAATLSIFLKSWALGGGLEERRAIFGPRVTGPPKGPGFPLPGGRSSGVKVKIERVSKRYVFDKSKIAALKAKAASDGVKQPTRVEVVTALIWRCAINAARSNSELNSHNVLFQLLDIRQRVEPPFPENTTGNLVGSSVVQVDYNELQKLGLQGLVAKLRRETEEFSENEAKRLGGDDAAEAVSEWSKEVEDLIGGDDDTNFSSVCDSWCDYGFYEVDFGWGKPIWASRPSSSQEKYNIFALMDTRESGGVEVRLSLSKETMASFERDPELLAFASPIYIVL